ncbi:hypothetical protein Ahy_B03g062818 isoform B [Arachis hypogaea]|uniref:Uncharacterized protein n=1 Tax=Arachis hypogaea TaxID=3818 RepID=A0A444ZVI9_ARAHY|nr:hypothetical protein Ahy_B03g062818 isoform B [Arachis hypogaea]
MGHRWNLFACTIEANKHHYYYYYP